MEPTLKDGDVVFVRKSDGLLQKRTWQKEEEYEEEVERKLERQKLQDFEEENCSASPFYWFIKKPPLPLTEDVVVYKDPEYYSERNKYCIKRVIGLGGQIVMVPSSSLKSSYRMDDNPTSMRIATTSVPPYSLWVHGDNLTNSYDSRNKEHGPVSKKLLVGIAEYILWPPTRWGVIQNINSPEPRPQSYWT